MKKYLLSTIVVLGIGVFASNVHAQDLNEMKKQREVLKTATDLLDKRMELLKEQQNNEKKQATASSLNNKADRKSDGFSDENNAEAVAKNAKEAAKALKKSESANKDLQKSNAKIIDIEADIRKLEMQLNSMTYIVEVKEK